MKIKLKVSCGYVGCDWEEDASDWITPEEVELFNDGKLDTLIESDIRCAAVELASFEYYLEIEE